VNRTPKQVGKFYTPSNVVDQYTILVKESIRETGIDSNDLNVLDLFSGDGRLGTGVLKALLDNYKVKSITFLDSDLKAIENIEPVLDNTTFLNTDGFSWKENEKYNLVLTNPPYLQLTSKLADKLNISWDSAKDTMKNLFGLGIIKALETCTKGGLVCAIAPFSWTRGKNSTAFRFKIASICSDVQINAFTDRNIFENTHQDVAVQIFKKNGIDQNHPKCKFRFKYDFQEDYSDLDFHYFPVKCATERIPDVFVGSVVWNREKDLLTTKSIGAFPLIYGGNISHYGKLDLEIPKYKDRQYMTRNYPNKNKSIRAPFLLIRRIMRGNPGNWIIDHTIVEKKFECFAENHVIVIQFTDKIEDFKLFTKAIIQRISEYYFYSGSPTISANVVKSLVYQILRD